MAKKQFKAESKRLLDLMINSIYTHKEIFLREIISNASDAIDKLCYVSLTDENVGMNREDFCIRVNADKEARTITVSDNGIGMTKEEMESNLGVIARSGSLKFKQDMEEKPDDLDIIGQFGVGFYSAFMIADDVTVISRAYGSETACKWESTGADGYTITDCEKDGVGTDVIMHVKPDSEDEDYCSFLDSWTLQSLIRKYSDYVRWPIIMNVETTTWEPTGEKDEDGNDKKEPVTKVEAKTINSMIPIWQRSRSEVSEDDCKTFYKEKFHDTDDPIAVIRINAEGLVSYKAMLFVPATAPYDYYTRDYESGLQLYSSGVMIMEKCADLVPDCFRFVRGIVDSPDLSLNISREMLQHDRQLKTIAQNLEKKIKAELKKVLDEKPEDYKKFWENFGLQLKYGVVQDYGMKKDLLEDLLLFRNSGENDFETLSEYANKMPEGQKYIYYACADSEKRADSLPQTELVKKAGFEILYLTDSVDEFVVQMLGKYNDKEFRSVNSDDLGLESDEEKKEIDEKEAESKPVLDFVKETLGEKIHDVRLSHKLVSHPVCLTTDGGITLEMEKYFASLPAGQGGGLKAQRVLEINGDHPAFAALKAAYETDKDRAAKMSEILLDQALLIAGVPLDDPAASAELVCSLF